METTMSSRNDLLQAYINILNEIIKSSGKELASRECNITFDEDLLTQLKDTYKEFIDIKNKEPKPPLENVSYDKSVTQFLASILQPISPIKIQTARQYWRQKNYRSYA